MKNIEIKYRISRMAEISAFLATLPEVKLVKTIQQKDVYYKMLRGRLKLRIPSSGMAELIYYERENLSTARESHYYLFPVETPVLLHKVLEKALGISVIVEKERKLYMFRNVRIHLDRVIKLGEFLEFESVVDENTPTAQAEKNLRQIQQKLAHFKLFVQPRSYADLIKEKH